MWKSTREGAGRRVFPSELFRTIAMHLTHLLSLLPSCVPQPARVAFLTGQTMHSALPKQEPPADTCTKKPRLHFPSPPCAARPRREGTEAGRCPRGSPTPGPRCFPERPAAAPGPEVVSVHHRPESGDRDTPPWRARLQDQSCSA